MRLMPGMRTKLVLDDDLVAEAASLTGIREKAVLVHQALKALARIRTPLGALGWQRS